ncbi:hypothetical protein KAFR_0G01710 [Kazachstania africana CBS 2517]|uniref:Anaphase-promoting complex subunit 4-like WD40 domain-containing protein n=1 Tax=Kazachstania africana (strain ATCC 22294 / BCRC 22015 / CBS 2517 / CECT 1963 / NBRC 1671 / NRRL Y-8276) TaxID=1071382 RepID=H2AXV5_KAZAF|nr:hypothetical protein KAFR_0G01710 [Kazachstania africana CBS 2517]CCF59205.1 hypothetical protein KAFR_0G01710 [Kazachstania africana CBS 2517]
MSITSEEVNYLIWRYLQEMGKEVSALALQEETRVLEFDSKYNENIPIGTLVNLLQRGILYTESELLIDYEGNLKEENEAHFRENFNLVDALKIDKEKYPEIANKGRFSLENEPIIEELEPENGEEPAEKQAESIHVEQKFIATAGPSFVKTLTETFRFDTAIVTTSWNPVLDNTLCIGLKDTVAKIVEFNDSGTEIISAHELRHPFALSSRASDNMTNQVTSLSWSPNGEYIVTAVENGEMRLWNKTGQLQNVLNYHGCPILAIKWNIGSMYFISLDIDNVVIVWDVSSGILQHFELSTGTGGESLGVDIEWVDKNKFVIPGFDGDLVVHEVSEKKSIGKLVGHRGPISCINFNNDSKLLATSADDFTIRVWHGGSNNCVNCFYGHSQSIVSLHWINDDEIISSSMDGSVRIWSLSQNRLIGNLIIDGTPILVGKLSKDKKKYCIGCMDGQIYTLDVELFQNNHEKLLESQNETIIILNIPIDGNYQNNRDNDNVFELSWNFKNDKLSVAYSVGEGVILSI